ncbi:uncharacterized protein LOC117291828 isoform X1 [Asterias rubens]|uniref:uncharacterized protein LOC117291828 isoform X1 n=2 Tax=Asterias rubens TaxID=7604 RepID=UPI001455C0AF|nr:uncharacterized protein LOC117291828 isoform X1 [Asterias rubens]
MASDLKTSGIGETNYGGLGGSTCQNVATFVHKIPSPTPTSVIQFYNQHNSYNPDNHRHTILEEPSKDATASVTMTSYKLDTGVFLQQFTNSVSRALHKQTCSCSGRSYSADELFLRSNPAIFATNVTESCSRQSTADSLPFVSRSGCMAKHKTDASTAKHSSSSPNMKLEYEFIPRGSPTHRMKIKMLGDASPMKRLKRQSNLPEKMNVTDKNGQNWQVVQNFPKHVNRSSSHQNPSCSSQELELQTPPNTSRLAMMEVGRSKHDASERNSPRHRGIHLPKHITNETDITHNNSLEHIQIQNAPSPGPTPTDLPVIDLESTPADGFLSSRNTPREADRKFILSLLNSAVRKRQITYEDFLKRASQLTSALSNRDNNEDGLVESRNQNNNSPSSDVSELKSGGTHLPSLNAFDKTGEQVPAQHHLPTQLEDLYTKGRLKILKFDIGGVLPDNFLQKDRDKLRQMYPMYDWRVGQGARLVKMKHSPVKTVAPNKKDILATNCTLQLPKMFPKDGGKDLRDKGHNWRDWKSPRRAVGVRGDSFAVTDQSEATNGSKVKDGESGAAAMEEERVGDGEAMEEMRPCSGSMIPRQPPPTPMESRRKQTLETLKEID